MQEARSNLPQASTGFCLLGFCVRLPPWKLSQGQSLKVEPAQTSSEGDVNMLNVSQGGLYTLHTKLVVPENTGIKITLPFKSQKKSGQLPLLNDCGPDLPQLQMALYLQHLTKNSPKAHRLEPGNLVLTHKSHKLTWAFGIRRG